MIVLKVKQRIVNVRRFRWDKANLADYYAASRDCLSRLLLLATIWQAVEVNRK